MKDDSGWRCDVALPHDHYGRISEFLAARLGEKQLDAELTIRREDQAPSFELDPVLALREVDAARAILAEYQSARADHLTNRTARLGSYNEVLGTLERTVRRHAAVYRDHPDYDPAWAISA